MNEQDNKLILSSIRALQGEITSSLRSVSVELREKTIVWQCLFDSDATEDDFELMSEACTEVRADYDWDYSLEEIIKYVPAPEKMKYLKNLIYLRHEQNYYK